MRTQLPSAALFAVLVAACGNTPASFPGEDAAAALLAPADARSQLPFRGSCTGTGTQLISFEPPVLRQVATAACTVSHLGRITIVNQQEFNTATGVQLGQATWTTASGDRIHASSVGTATRDGAGNLDFSGTTTIAGGTGRFTTATGEMAVAGTVPAGGAAQFTYEGWIRYGAAAGN